VFVNRGDMEPIEDNTLKIINDFGMNADSFDFRAIQLAHGDTNQLQGFGRGAGVKVRQALADRAAQYWMDQGVPPEVAMNASAEWLSKKAGARTPSANLKRVLQAL
jgi:hypothetical protein